MELPHDEVYENGEVGEDVARRYKGQHEGHLKALVLLVDSRGWRCGGAGVA